MFFPLSRGGTFGVCVTPVFSLLRLVVFVFERLFGYDKSKRFVFHTNTLSDTFLPRGYLSKVTKLVCHSHFGHERVRVLDFV